MAAGLQCAKAWGVGVEGEYSADGCERRSAKTAHAYGQGWWYRGNAARLPGQALGLWGWESGWIGRGGTPGGAGNSRRQRPAQQTEEHG
jgi:hypothetical protein